MQIKQRSRKLEHSTAQGSTAQQSRLKGDVLIVSHDVAHHVIDPVSQGLYLA